MEMNERKKSSKKWMIVAICLMLVSMIGASIVQSSGGRVVIKDIRWETPKGQRMSALLFVPKSATADKPAPAVITSHGWFNNREMQDLNYVELARRGYVVMSIDMYGHGNSDYLADMSHGIGMYDAVELMATFPYVDKTKIGITGHSNGALAANLSINDDNQKAKPLVAAVLMVANDPDYKIDDKYANKFGARDIGIIAAQYDEFFFRRDLPGGGKSVPRTYYTSLDAQSFLNFGRDPAASGSETRNKDEFYEETVNGQKAWRIIWQPEQIHPWNHFSKTVETEYLTFWDKVFGAPNPIPPQNQIWQIKVFFNLLGLVGIVMFLISFVILMTFTPFFASLRADKIAAPQKGPSTLPGKLWFWVPLCASALVSWRLYLPSLVWGGAIRAAGLQGLFLQDPPMWIGVWAVLTGVFAIICMLAYYYTYAKKQGLSAVHEGITVTLPKLGKTILLALLSVAAAYAWVFIADYFFKADFRMWVLAIKAFSPDKLIVALPCLPLYLVFYVASSVSVNSINYNEIGGRKEWGNTALLAAASALGPVIIVLIQYITFRITGEMHYTRFGLAGSIGPIWLFPIIVILPVSVIISRKIYRVTRNPYLAGIINACLITIISCTNTLTEMPPM